MLPPRIAGEEVGKGIPHAVLLEPRSLSTPCSAPQQLAGAAAAPASSSTAAFLPLSGQPLCAGCGRRRGPASENNRRRDRRSSDLSVSTSGQPGRLGIRVVSGRRHRGRPGRHQEHHRRPRRSWGGRGLERDRDSCPCATLQPRILSSSPIPSQIRIGGRSSNINAALPRCTSPDPASDAARPKS